jgi:hypothetical protein
LPVWAAFTPGLRATRPIITANPIRLIILFQNWIPKITFEIVKLISYASMKATIVKITPNNKAHLSFLIFYSLFLIVEAKKPFAFLYRG